MDYSPWFRSKFLSKLPTHAATYHVNVEGWVSVDPVSFVGADDVLEGEGVAKPRLFREIEVCGIEAVVDCHEHLAFTGVRHPVVLGGGERGEGRGERGEGGDKCSEVTGMLMFPHTHTPSHPHTHTLTPSPSPRSAVGTQPAGMVLGSG